VVVLEDVVTTGKSAMVAVERLRNAGYQVDLIIALVDKRTRRGGILPISGNKVSSFVFDSRSTGGLIRKNSGDWRETLDNWVLKVGKTYRMLP
jgi:pyrimidine operon attenuation protein/uracil phosphoribosyltransferase